MRQKGGRMKYRIIGAGVCRWLVLPRGRLAAAQQKTADRLYILNCGEGVAGDIARWTPGATGPRDFVDNCYLIRHGQDWLAVGRACRIPSPTCRRPAAARARRRRAGSGRRTSRPTRRTGREARRSQIRRRLAFASRPYRQCRTVPADDAARAEGRTRMAGRSACVSGRNIRQRS